MTDITRFFCLPVAEAIHQVLRSHADTLQEIRLRVGKPLAVTAAGGNYFVSPKGELLQTFQGALRVDWDMIVKSLEFMSRSSLYAFESEMRNGYITVEGGHRIGMVGRTICQNGQIVGINPVAGLNVRISHEIRGCADKLLPHVTEAGLLLHTLIVSPPGGGKTTMLRDLIRLTSDKLRMSVGVADERSEIGGCYRGIPQCDLGMQTDVLDGCPKAEGMLMLLRTMNPQVIAVDELGGRAELEAVVSVLHAGVKLLCTAHSDSLAELEQRPGFDQLLQMGVFERIVILGGQQGPGTIVGVYRLDEDGRYALA